uniref:MCM C-terminal AAA(+) ATPase domain-containing protein n=1 Tax=Hucho hucho TaxID=62062 RepID=A0A4W5LA66_9TELE
VCFLCEGFIQSSPYMEKIKFTMPTKCVQPGCRSRSFIPNRSSPLTLTELIGGEQREAGRIPRDGGVSPDLCDSAVPGDTVTIMGTVQVCQDDGGRSMFLLYIEANSISQKGQGSSGDERSSGIKFSLKVLYAIQEIHSQPDLLKLICVCVASLSLALFGGSQKHADDKNRIPIRGDLHILVVGDPGLGRARYYR